MKYITLAVSLIGLLAFATNGQNLGFERSRHTAMLETVKNTIKKNYYDPNFRGINLDERFKQAEEKIKQATSIGQMAGTIAQVLVDFDDSHLFFIPPGKTNKTKYGFEMKMIGDKCFVSRVHEKSDAYAKGLRIGDEIVDLERFIPSRKNLWLMNYFYRALRPQPTIEIAVRKPDGKEGIIKFEAKIIPGKQVLDLASSSMDINRYIRESEDAYNEAKKQFVYEAGDDVLLWEMPGFSLSPSEIDDMMGKAKSKKTLILDLRGNGGGRVDSLKRLVGNFFDRDVKIGDEKARKETKEIIAKSVGKSPFAGKLVVLIDSESGSASEIFARVVQIEKRGHVMGDVSAGAVMESRYYPQQTGMDVVVFYGISVTIADLIMTDGKSLEKIGVTPDEQIIPTAADVAANRDVVLSKALASVGVDMTPEQAGALFAKEKKKFQADY